MMAIQCLHQNQNSQWNLWGIYIHNLSVPIDIPMDTYAFNGYIRSIDIPNGRAYTGELRHGHIPGLSGRHTRAVHRAHVWFFWSAGSKHLTLENYSFLMLIIVYSSLFKFIQVYSDWFRFTVFRFIPWPYHGCRMLFGLHMRCGFERCSSQSRNEIWKSQRSVRICSQSSKSALPQLKK